MVTLKRSMGDGGGSKRLADGTYAVKILDVVETRTGNGDPMIVLELRAPGLTIKYFLPLSNGWRVGNLLDALEADSIESDAMIGAWLDAALVRDGKYLNVDRLDPCRDIPQGRELEAYEDDRRRGRGRGNDRRERDDDRGDRRSARERGERPRPRSSYGNDDRDRRDDRDRGERRGDPYGRNNRGNDGRSSYGEGGDLPF